MSDEDFLAASRAANETRKSTFELVDAIAVEFKGDTRPATYEDLAAIISAVALLQTAIIDLQAAQLAATFGRTNTDEMGAVQQNLHRVTQIVGNRLRLMSTEVTK